MSDFEKGTVYSRRNNSSKTYYLAINHHTLVTYNDGSFGKYTMKKHDHSGMPTVISESNVSVLELCEFWNIRIKKLDEYMLSHFQPDEDAKLRARKDRELEVELLEV
jgi:hypothetical protein